MTQFNGSGGDSAFVLEAVGPFPQPIVSDFAFLVSGLKSHIPKNMSQKRRSPFANVSAGGFILAGLKDAHVQAGKRHQLIGSVEGGDRIGFTIEANGLYLVDARQTKDVSGQAFGQVSNLLFQLLADKPNGINLCQQRSDANNRFQSR